MIVFSDLHLKEANEHTVWEALEKVEALAIEDPDSRVVFCGDFWQLRYQVSVRLLNKVRDLLATWNALGLEVDLVPGNHDQVTVDGVNALEVLAQDGVDVWTQPGIKQSEADCRWSGFVPYRKDPEEQLIALQMVREALQEERASFPVIFGHFGVRGATMNTSKVDQEGLKLPSLDKMLLVLGHYHKFQWVTDLNAGLASVVYVGSVFQHTFGEAGNVTGAAQVLWNERSGWEMTHVELAVGPKHHIVTWDLETQERPPDPMSLVKGVPGEGDKVRLDVRAPPSLINPDLIKTIKASGYGAAQVNVQPAPERREHRFNMQVGEDLLQAAERFVALRLEEQIEPSEHPLCRKLYELAGEL